MSASHISVLLATVLLLFGIYLGFLDFELNLKILHAIIGFSFIFIVVSGLKIHYIRLINKSPINFISWMHFFIFSFLLFLSIRALRHWHFSDKKKHVEHIH